MVSKSALQFKGNSQHDAQEFLLWLLDRVHEDLNNIIHPESRPPRKVNSYTVGLYKQYRQYIFRYILQDVVSLAQPVVISRALSCASLPNNCTVPLLFFQPPVEDENAPEGSPQPAPGSFVQELFQAQYR